MDYKITLTIILILISGAFAVAQTKASKKKSNPYLDLRNQFFSLKPQDLQLHIANNEEKAFGAIFEVEIGNGVVTIISLSTGDASMYTSTGGGVIGGITHQNVKNAAIDFVTTAQTFYHKISIAQNFDTPKKGNMKFFILTNKHKYSFEGSESEITNEHSAWFPLFEKANEVITQLRLISNK